MAPPLFLRPTISPQRPMRGFVQVLRHGLLLSCGRFIICVATQPCLFYGISQKSFFGLGRSVWADHRKPPPPLSKGPVRGLSRSTGFHCVLSFAIDRVSRTPSVGCLHAPSQIEKDFEEFRLLETNLGSSPFFVLSSSSTL